MNLFTLNFTFGGETIDIYFDEKGFEDFLKDYEKMIRVEKRQKRKVER